MWKNSKLSYGGDTGSEKSKRVYSGVYGGSEGVCLEGIWSQVVGFVMVTWQDCGYSRRKGVFTLNLLKK
jgi:hypothetical protein